MLSFTTKLILLLVEKVEGPYFELTVVRKGLVESAGDCARCQQGR
jgi:hypothetical protein